MGQINPAQIDAIRVALNAAAEECSRSPTGNILEGHLKSVILDSLLHAGYGVLEGSTKNTGKHIRLREGKLLIERQPRPKMVPAAGSAKKTLSPDIRIWSPVKVVLELQVRSVVGSQDALFSDNLADDLERVGRGAADALILAADRPLYDGLRGIKADPRGRKALHTDVLSNALPDATRLSDSVASLPVVSQCGGFVYLGTRAKTVFGIDRVAVAVWKAV